MYSTGTESPTAISNILRTKNPSTWTRTVMSVVPTFFIESLWLLCKSDYGTPAPFPIEFEYFKKLIDNLGYECSTDTRSRLGKLFSVVLETGRSITICTLSQLL